MKNPEPALVQIPKPPTVTDEQLLKELDDGEDSPHDSAYVHSALIDKHTLKVFPTLSNQEKSNAQMIIIGLLLVVSIFSGCGIAYVVVTALTPHVPGTCAPPAVIENGGCFIAQSSTDSNGATHTTLIPAGVLGH